MCRHRCGIFLSTYNFQYVYTLKSILSAIAAAVATKVRCIVGYLAVLDKNGWSRYTSAHLGHTC